MSLIQKLINLVVDNKLRKWSIMATIIVIGVVFKLTNEINGVEFVSLVSKTTIAFMSSNAVEYIGGIVKGKKEDMSED